MKINKFVFVVGVFLLSMNFSWAQAQEAEQESAKSESLLEDAPDELVPTGAQAKTQERKCRPAIFNSEEMFCLRRGVGSFSPTERVDSFIHRIKIIADDRTKESEDIKVVADGENYSIVFEQQPLIRFGVEDLAIPPDSEFEDVVQATAEKIRQQIDVYRKQRSPHDLLFGALYSLLALSLLILFLALVFRFSRRLIETIHASKGHWVTSLKIKSYEVLTADRISDLLAGAIRLIRLVITLFTLYFAVPLILVFFPWTENLAPKVAGYVLHPVSRVWDVFVDYLPSLFFLAVIGYLTHLSLKLVKFFFKEVEQGHIRFEGFHRDWATPTYKLARTFLLVIALVMAFPYLPGSDSPAFKGISVFLGILLSLGSSSAIGNMVAGVVLTYMRPFVIGDRVEIAGTVGDVIEKTLLVTRVRTIKNVDITIPNSLVLNSHILNYSTTARAGLILNPVVTVGYEVPWRQVHDLLREAAEKTNMVKQKPEPFVLQTGFNNFDISYELNVFTDEPNKAQLVYSLLRQNIQDVFNKAGVEILSPEYLNLRTESKSEDCQSS
ncbi:mechanosensitive ion channel family protein [Bdellovibrio bacteriovorus]|nr:mechanosensitive ion channel family protein [Bdellovibrio bacteriovorus]